MTGDTFERVQAVMEGKGVKRHGHASVQQLDQHRGVVVSKLDRGYDDYVSGKISVEFDFSIKSQIPTEQRRLLDDTVLSNCTFDRGSLCPTYASPFDLACERERNRKLAERESALMPSAHDAR